MILGTNQGDCGKGNIQYEFDPAILFKLLKEPFSQHPEVTVLGGLRAVHIQSLLQSLSKLSKRHEELQGGSGAAFYTLVYHLAGGNDTELAPPPRKGESDKPYTNFWARAKKLYARGSPWYDRTRHLKARAAASEPGASEALRAHLEAQFCLSPFRRPQPDAAVAKQPCGGKRAAAALPAPEPLEPRPRPAAGTWADAGLQHHNNHNRDKRRRERREQSALADATRRKLSANGPRVGPSGVHGKRHGTRARRCEHGAQNITSGSCGAV